MAPIYESSVILKASLKKPELREALKRVSHYVLDRSGIIHSMENLGTRALPHKMRSDQGKTSTGSYFILKYAVPADASNEINDSLVADVDVLRHGTMKLDTLTEHKPPDCTHPRRSGRPPTDPTLWTSSNPCRDAHQYRPMFTRSCMRTYRDNCSTLFSREWIYMRQDSTLNSSSIIQSYEAVNFVKGLQNCCIGAAAILDNGRLNAIGASATGCHTRNQVLNR